MGEGKSSTLVHILVVALSLTAFGFAIAAERRRSTGKIITDIMNQNVTYCVYDSDVATGYGAGSFLFLFCSQALVMGITKCMCFGRPLAPGSNRAWTIIYFASSWLSFLIAESCLIGGATRNAYHTKYRHVIYAQSWTCSSLRKGVFIAAAVFVVFTMVLNVYYYMYFAKTMNQASRKASRASSSIGMTGYA
ncbi:hypothetical protein HPP92_021496 [Vanilla planifolia]|uniref:Uncharacterized protein n=1 Tax=Vanilla planifolia TaxID=51239 RepID=A0A835Q560_VANPL|nr:hypothetical protein HPP92_021859 [Vanilla planifolia]KAG0463020.1 hypothetical protein HPP92_021496 [Vanilla planifolia]